MGWSSDYIVIFTIPTGATSGQRIVIDGTTGLISIYNSANVLVDQLGGPNGAAIFGPQPGPNFQFNEPSAGLLTTVDATGQITAQWDPSNQVLTLLDNIALTFVQITGFDVKIGQINTPGVLPNNTQVGNACRIFSNSAGFLALESGITSVNQDLLFVGLQAGQGGIATGQPLTPKFIIIDQLGSSGGSPADALQSGNLIKCDLNGVQLALQTPSYAASWSGSTTFNGSTGWSHLTFRLLNFDMLEISGAFTASGAGPGNTVFTLPAASGALPSYRPAAQAPIWVQRNRAAVQIAGYAQVQTSGAFVLPTATGFSAPATGDEYLVNGTIPLRNVP